MNPRFERAKRALARAVELLEGCSGGHKGDRNIEFQLWQVVNESDYAAAVLSILHGLSDFNPASGDLDLSNRSANSTLPLALQLLREAYVVMESNPKDAYAKIRRGIRLIRPVQKAIKPYSSRRFQKVAEK